MEQTEEFQSGFWDSYIENTGKARFRHIFNLIPKNRFSANFYHRLRNIAPHWLNSCSHSASHYYSFHICLLLPEIFLDFKTERMVDRKMKLPNFKCLGLRNDNCNVGKLLQFSARFSCERDCYKPFRFRDNRRIDYIL